MPYKFNPFTNRLDYYEAGGGGGTVTSVSGTANRITVTNPTTTPVIDIAATYIGQTSITTLGTIVTGVWNGTAVGPTFGGTGQTSYTTGDTLYASAANTLSKLPIGTAGQVLTVAAGVPVWQTAAPFTPTAFRAHLNANTAPTITGDGTFVTVPFDTVDYDFGSGYNAGTGVYTVPVGAAGIYQINYTIFTYRVAGTNTVQFSNYVVNGATVVRNYEVNFENMQTSGELTLTSGAQYLLAAGDTVEVTCVVAGSGAKNIGFAGTYCVFSMNRVA